MNFFRVAFVVLVFIALPLSARSASAGEAANQTEQPKLLLYLVSDQFRADYIQRFAGLYTGGLKKLIAEGLHFEEAHFENAFTMTCTGHSIIATGYFPNKTGIVSNYWFDREAKKERYCVYDKRYGSSPVLSLKETFSDALKSERGGRVYSVSGKDRAAVLMGGRRADASLWYDKKKGRFRSSRYYKSLSKKTATAIKSYLSTSAADEYFGKSWEPLRVSMLPEGSEIFNFDFGQFRDEFPHSLGRLSLARDASFYSSLYKSPFVDKMVIDLALKLAHSEKLGLRGKQDVLSLSLSAVDTIGHAYGPNSREMLDTVLRLDKNLGYFIEKLSGLVGEDNLLIVFTADHGVQPYPEYFESKGEHAHRVDADDVACVQRISRELEEKYKVKKLFLANLYLNEEAIVEAELDFAEVRAEAARALETCPMIKQVFTAPFSPTVSGVEKRFRNNYFPTRSPDLMPLLAYRNLASSFRGTNHGTPYSYDTHVPLVFWGANISRGKVAERVAIVDVAATLYDVFGLETPIDLDGKSLTAHFQ